ncbi:hypothetical protein ACL1BJ_09715 [Corynebacterium striatum]
MNPVSLDGPLCQVGVDVDSEVIDLLVDGVLVPYFGGQWERGEFVADGVFDLDVADTVALEFVPLFWGDAARIAQWPVEIK